jgi:hypothetical protein
MNDNTVINWLKTYWFLLSALVVVGIAWGQTTKTVSELQKKVDASASQQQKVDDIKSTQSRLDERTLIMQQEQKEQKELLMQLLMGQRAIINQVAAVPPQKNVKKPVQQ